MVEVTRDNSVGAVGNVGFRPRTRYVANLYLTTACSKVGTAVRNCICKKFIAILKITRLSALQGISEVSLSEREGSG